MKEKWLEVLN